MKILRLGEALADEFRANNLISGFGQASVCLLGKNDLGDTGHGKRIYNSVSKEAWALWMKHQTMLVNENRLNLADQRARQYLARQMENFFFGTGAEQPVGYVPPSA